MSHVSEHAPLVWFTALAIAGSGMIAASALHTPADLTSQAIGLTVGTIALGAGMLVSLLHLGRKSRAPLAVGGFSALSVEVLLAGATLVAALALLTTLWQAYPAWWTRIASATSASLFLLSIGRVYRLRGQRTWRGLTPLLPLTTGLVCGEFFLQAIGNASTREASPAFWIVAIDVSVFGFRWWTLARGAAARTPARADVSRLHSSSAARLLVFDVVPLVLLDRNAAGLAFAAVAVGLALDRWLFYALADQHTTEAEVARVEAIIEGQSRIG